MTKIGCEAGANLVLALTGDNSGANTKIDTAVAAKWLKLTLRRVF